MIGSGGIRTHGSHWLLQKSRLANAGTELRREIGNSEALRPFAKCEIIPGLTESFELENFIWDGIATVWHQASVPRGESSDKRATGAAAYRSTRHIVCSTTSSWFS
jgi:hypothetical protein